MLHQVLFNSNPFVRQRPHDVAKSAGVCTLTGHSFIMPKRMKYSNNDMVNQYPCFELSLIALMKFKLNK